MIIVSGSKRSGTSMWMRALAHAGFPIIGEAFPANWRSTIGVANPHGFYESRLTSGVHALTNPSPVTGEYLSPADSRTTAVKIFAPGLVRSDIAFLDRVIVTCRPWDEYCASIDDLRALSAGTHETAVELDESRSAPSAMHPALEWWSDLYSILRDVAARRYPIHLQTFAGLLADPQRAFDAVFAWLGHGDAAAAAATVDAACVRHSRDAIAVTTPDLPGGAIELFDELYDRLHRTGRLSDAFVAQLNGMQSALAPVYAEHRARARDAAAARIVETARTERTLAC